MATFAYQYAWLIGAFHLNAPLKVVYLLMSCSGGIGRKTRPVNAICIITAVKKVQKTGDRLPVQIPLYSCCFDHPFGQIGANYRILRQLRDANRQTDSLLQGLAGRLGVNCQLQYYQARASTLVWPHQTGKRVTAAFMHL